ncbi:hypothetical protein FRACYDRAFT_249571 [Fragilariopsis cylindrus CCMP1102]|uniref:Uncharacterized protein n=1 Tax=Fragilariopsis cylindrus CCMP1102 TaxID=635003 RepID=A0A1E7ERM0_9STRA|nr:hypothetical protein FRACYDRAFT_249571 [Fragilariopsis cylindrus CCMP1102]|eukprot:OEU08670.1 hypothetical protein FRACYDRAFT_249571 [Fragilariopsis cylindrus CCMP1102]
MSSDDQIDGAIVDTKILESKRNSPCNMCNFEDWEPGDTKYVVEHWMKDDDEDEDADADADADADEDKDEDEDEDEDKDKDADEEDFDRPSREHLCPECAISRGLDYDEYYKQNQNATLKSKEEIPLTANAYKKILKRQQQQL